MINLVLIGLCALMMVQSSPKSLDDLKWKNRVVLYFPQKDLAWQNPNDSLLLEMEERKIIFFVIRDSVESNSDMVFSADYISKLDSRYKMGAKSPSWVLIGLDGGAKLRKEEVLNWSYIFKTIDAMPMRQSEIRKSKGF